MNVLERPDSLNFVVVFVVVVETFWFQSLLRLANILSSSQIATTKSDLERIMAMLSALCVR